MTKNFTEKELQEFLNKQGYNLKVDGVAGPKTKAAFDDFSTRIFKSLQSTKKMTFIKPLTGKISSPFGPRIHPVTKEVGRHHNGVDIPAPEGKHIVSPSDGKIIKYFFCDLGGGNTLFIEHANGFQSRMAHLNKALVKVGDVVKQGQVVAENGNTGKSTGPHLHYGLVLNGKHVNPEDYIQFG